MPRVSIIMSMQNSAGTIHTAIRSLQLQTLRDWELVLFDDGSSDDSAAVVRAMADPRIRLFIDKDRRGLAFRLNQAVAEARGRYIARFDADDLCFPQRLEKQVTYLSDNPDIDVVASRAAVFAGDELIGLLPVASVHQDIVSHPYRGFAFPHPTWCGKADWFRANPYDGKLRKTQDQDLLLRTFSHSRFAGLADVLVAYRQPGLDLGKMLRGRWVFIKSLCRTGVATGRWLSVADGVATHVLKGVSDILTRGLGLDSFLQRHRLLAVPDETRRDWSAMRSELLTDRG